MKIVLIGGSSDIGKSLVERLAENNEIISTYNSKNPDKDLPTVTNIKLDISNKEDINYFIENNISHEWDILIFLPATMKPIGLFEEVDGEEWVKSIEVNFTNQLYLLKKILPFRKINKELIKTVIFCAGPGTNNATVRHSSYTISKIALIKITELLDKEIDDIKFSVIGPGWVKTKIHKEVLDAGKNAGKMFVETQKRLKNENFNSMDRVIDSFDYVIKNKKIIVGGRNISSQSDKLEEDSLLNVLEIDKDIYKLRRDFNDFQLSDLDFNVEDSIKLFSSNPSLQNPKSIIYKLFKRILILKFDQIFKKKKILEKLFGFEINFPFFEMGTINSAHLFGIDELFILDFYIRNKNTYNNTCDIGCNIGLHSLFMNLCGFNVTSFEPDPVHYSIAKENLTRFNIDNLNNKAVSNYDGKASFTRITNNTTGSYINDKKSSYGPTEVFDVDVVNSKSLSQKFDLIKIDAEGSELDILSNFDSETFLKTDIIMEISTEENRVALWELIKKYNLKVYSQKNSWNIASEITLLPVTHMEGSIFISCKNKFI